MKTESTVKPTEKFKIENIKNGKCTVYFFDLDNIEEIEKTTIENEEIEKTYLYNMYSIETFYRSNLQESIKNNYKTWFEFVKSQEKDKLAAEIRVKRNKLLEETDSEMCLDRMNLEVPSGTSFSSWLNFFKSIGNAITGDMAKYRQELRDITKQDGFPYNVTFPTKPTKEE